MKCTVIIVTKNRKALLSRCITSILTQSDLPDELLVVDNGSTDGTQESVRALRQTQRIPIRLVIERKTGYPAIYNRGLRECAHPWAVFIDDDCVAQPGWFSGLKRSFHDHPDAHVIVGNSTTANRNNIFSLAIWFTIYLWKYPAINGSTVTDYEVLDNKNIAYRRSFLNKYRLHYDENRSGWAHGAAEDADLGMQIWEAGGKAVYAPSMLVTHDDPATFPAYVRKVTSSTKAMISYERRWGSFRFRHNLGTSRAKTFPTLRHFLSVHRLPNAYLWPLLFLLAITYAYTRALRKLLSPRLPFSASIRSLNGGGGSTAHAPHLPFFFLLFVFAIIVAFSVPGRDASMLGGNPGRTGYVAGTTVVPQWWRIRLQESAMSAVATDGTRIYTGGSFPAFYAYDTRSGKELWKFTSEGEMPFSPVIDRHTVYTADVNGILHALRKRDGSEQWAFHTPEYHQIATTPLLHKNVLYLGVFDGYLYSLAASSGSIRWRFKTNGFIESSPVAYKGLIIFGSYDSYVYAVHAADGSLAWRTKTGGKIIAAPSLDGNTVYIGSWDGRIYAINAGNGAILWQTDAGGPVDATVGVTGSFVYASTKSGSLHALHKSSGTSLWVKYIPGGWRSGPVIRNGTVYFAGADHAVHALNSLTGEEHWKFSMDDKIRGSPTITDRALLFTGDDGFLYALDPKTGRPVAPVVFSVSVPKQTGWRDTLEASITHTDSLYRTPSVEATISAMFISPSGKKTSVGAFYADNNRWGVRFSPGEIGTWNWTTVLRLTPSLTVSKSGTFESIRSSNPGYLRIDTDNPYRFTDERGNLFHPLGIQNSFNDWYDNSGTPLDNFGVDEAMTTLHQYAKTYGADGAGFNMFRFGIDNAAISLTEVNQYSVWYPVRYGIWIDSLLKTMRNNGFKIWFTLYGYHPPHAGESGEALDKGKAEIMEYVKHVVDRYGSYVDVWELSNEAFVTKDWAKFTSGYLRSIDPYKHPISISWEGQHLGIEDISITAPHWYDNEPELESDAATAREIDRFRWERPVVFAEQGNKTANWDERSATRMRIRIWTAFFQEAGIIFWNSSGTKRLSRADNSNIYLGPEERKFVSVLQSFLKQVTRTGQRSVPLTDPVTGTRTYTLPAGDNLIGYSHHFTNHTLQTTISSPIRQDSKGTVRWIDPQTGAIIRTDELSAGTHRPPSPPFTIDIAFVYTP